MSFAIKRNTSAHTQQVSIHLLNEQYILQRARIKLHTLLSPNTLYTQDSTSLTKTERPIEKHLYTNNHIPPDYTSCPNQPRIKGRKQTNLSTYRHINSALSRCLVTPSVEKLIFVQEASEALLKACKQEPEYVG